MTKSIYYFLCYKYFATYGAVFAFCQTCFGTIRCYCFINYFCVTKSWNYCLSYKCFATYGAVFAFCQTCVCTISSYCFINYFCVTKSCYCYCGSTYLSATYRAVGYVIVGAFGCAGCVNNVFLYGCARCVGNCCNGFRSCVTAIASARVCAYTCGCASWIRSYNTFVPTVTKCWDCGLRYNYFATSRAFFACC